MTQPQQQPEAAATQEQQKDYRCPVCGDSCTIRGMYVRCDNARCGWNLNTEVMLMPACGCERPTSSPSPPGELLGEIDRYVAAVRDEDAKSDIERADPMPARNAGEWLCDNRDRIAAALEQAEQDRRELELLHGRPFSERNYTAMHARLTSAERERDEARAQLADVTAERDKLAKFKAYVHERLDMAGVPADPDSPHRAEGCRIGGRLDWLIDELEKYKTLRGWAETAAGTELEQRMAEQRRAVAAEQREKGLREALEEIAKATEDRWYKRIAVAALAEESHART